ncbi:hypothetical protein C7S18_01890 [Ahniella affigens]|uniref:Calx-beta domain-containing protein n=1 Tax=Ahniella affigens TaxID=2021234 RepID=A0A2P1PME8_9GAMM|nr:Calx-beta domain-containing protein [Ahniella affigens]AVP96018.1 hypothetical protein C7S18_01890 [Ahniella affigens]
MSKSIPATPGPSPSGRIDDAAPSAALDSRVAIRIHRGRRGNPPTQGKSTRLPLAAALSAILFSPASQALTISVTNTADAGAGSLREALSLLNASTDPTNTLDVAPALSGQTIRPLTPLPALSVPVALDGNGVRFDFSADHDIRFETDKAFSIRESTLTGATEHAIRAIGDEAAVQIEHCLFQDNIANFYLGLDGGAVFVDGIGLTITNSQFIHNIATFAGGAAALHARYLAPSVPLLIADSQFQNNESNSTRGGGAIYLSGDQFDTFADLQRSTLSGNIAHNGDGGAISLDHAGGIDVRDQTRIENNHADGAGGGVSVIDALYSNVIDSVITGNTAGDFGGGFYTRQNLALEVTRSTISNNVGSGGVGGIGMFYYGDLTITDSIISGNTANRGGGGAYIGSRATAFHCQNSTFTQNQGGGSGAGAMLYDLSDGAVIDHCQFTDNVVTDADSDGAFADGGALASFAREGRGAQLHIVDSTFANNEAAWSAGGVFILAGSNAGPSDPAVLIERSTFSGNLATLGEGGGVHIRQVGPYSPGDVLFADSSLIQNTANSNGGGGLHLSQDAGQARLRNLTVSGNFANNQAGGIMLAKSPMVRVESSTIVLNDVDHADAGGGLVSDNIGVQEITIANSVLADNTAAAVADDLRGGANVSAGVSYSLVRAQGGASFSQGSGMLNLAPDLFPLANNGGHTETLLPRLHSPVVNAGDPAFTGADYNTDQRGLARVVGGRIDLGAVERAPAQFGAINIASGVTEFENSGSAALTVTRSSGQDGAVSVQYQTQALTATAGTDYTTTSGTLSWADGESGDKLIIVPLLDDPQFEADETLRVSLNSVTGGATLGNSQGTVTIANDDVAQPGFFVFTTPSSSVAETTSTHTVQVSRQGGTDVAVSVVVNAAAGSASNGSDYSFSPQTLNFAIGDAGPKTISVSPIDDFVDEPDETFDLVLANPTGGATIAGTGRHAVTILDNDVVGTVRIDPTSISVNEQAGVVSLSVLRSDVANAVSVQVGSSNGSAVAGSDFQPLSQTLNWSAGDGSARTISVNLIDDGIPEQSELFSVTLSNPTGGLSLAPDQSATVQIIDNDPQTLQFGAPSFNAAEGDGQATITVTRPLANFGAVSVQYQTTDGSAQQPSDYTAQSGTLNFADGESSKTFSIPVLVDGVAEASETVQLSLSSPVGAVLGVPANAVLNIANTPTPGTLALASANASIAEDGGSISLTVQRTGGSEGVVSVDFQTQDGSASGNQDYTNASGTLTFADGVTTQTIVVPILPDILAEGSETFSVRLQNPVGGAALGNALSTVTITNVAAPGQFRFANASPSFSETGGTATIVVERVQGSEGVAQVQYASADGSANAGLDYLPATGVLSFADGQTSASFSVPVLPDFVAEGDESVQLTLSNPTNGSALGTPATASLTINNVAAPGELQFVSALESFTESSGTANILVMRTQGSEGAVSVQYGSADGTAVGGLDYQPVSGTLSFASGELSKSISVPILPDTLAEGAETLALNLTGPAGGATLGGRSTMTIEIGNVAAPGQLRFATATSLSSESAGTLDIEVIRLSGSEGAVSVDFSTQDLSATAGSDYQAQSGTLTFADGELSQTVHLTILPDVLAEPSEQLQLTLGNAGGGAVISGQSSHLVTIQNVAAPGDFRFVAPSVSALETDAQAVFSVERVNGSEGVASVTVQTSDGSAVAGSDYTATTGVLNFADGQTTQSISVPILSDTIAEGPETAQISLSNPTGGATISSPNTSLLTIQNVAAPGQLQFAVATQSVAENAGSLTLTVSRTQGSEGAVSVLLSSSDGTATAGADYQPLSETVQFADGELSKTVTLTVLDDQLAEGVESLSVNLSNPSGGATLGGQASMQIQISNVPKLGRASISPSESNVAENALTQTVTVRRVQGSEGTLNAIIETSDLLAHAGSDYTATTVALTWPDGDTSDKLVTIPILDDQLVESSEDFRVRIPDALPGSPGSQQIVNINDDDTPGSLQWQTDALSVVESDGVAMLAVSRTGGVGNAISVQVQTQAGTADSADFSSVTTTLNWAAGDADSKTVQIPILKDTLNEAVEQFTISLSNPTGGAALGAQTTATVSIADNDPIGFVNFQSTSSSASEAAGTHNVVLTRTAGTAGAVSVTVIANAGSATEGMDFVLSNPTVQWADGEGGAKTLAVQVVNDALVEGAESAPLALGNPTGGVAIGRDTHLFDLIDDDAFGSLQFVVAAASVNETDSVAEIVVSRIGGSAGAISVDYQTVDLSASAGSDYQPVQGTLSWPDGDVSARTIAVPIVRDSNAEPTEMFAIELQNPAGGASLGSPSSLEVTIVDVAAAAPTAVPAWSRIASIVLGVLMLGMAGLFRRDTRMSAALIVGLMGWVAFPANPAIASDLVASKPVTERIVSVLSASSRQAGAGIVTLSDGSSLLAREGEAVRWQQQRVGKREVRSLNDLRAGDWLLIKDRWRQGQSERVLSVFANEQAARTASSVAASNHQEKLQIRAAGKRRHAKSGE